MSYERTRHLVAYRTPLGNLVINLTTEKFLWLDDELYSLRNMIKCLERNEGAKYRRDFDFDKSWTRVVL